MSKPMIVILGPTACGKTRIATLVAAAVDGEIISADSRQVYRGMDIGTGKDLADYFIEGKQIKAHLLDVAEAGEKYSIFDYKRDFDKAFADIRSRDKTPVVCGGSGMYIETALGLYNLLEVKRDVQLRAELENLSTRQLIEKLSALRPLHNTTDILDRERLIRAIEIATAEISHETSQTGVETSDEMSSTTIETGHALSLHVMPKKKDQYDNPPATDLIYGIAAPREAVRARITNRLQKRMEEGMVEEVKSLVSKGVTYETLQYYGLEYKYLALYLQGRLPYQEMLTQLNTAIHQFAKRQMTWFRRMEKRGIRIEWVESERAVERISSSIT